jgi:hypothetical protein
MDRRGKTTKGLGDILSSLTIAVLFLVILLLVVFSARTYLHGSGYQAANDKTRIVRAYVATAAKDNNGGEVSAGNFDGCPGIRIEDGDTGYSHLIYLKDGTMLEEYTRDTASITPDTASRIGETSTFEVNEISPGLLEITTDEGSSYVHIR